MARLDTVEEAAQALDELRPDWFKQVDTEILNMDWPKKCILGQLYGNYYDAPASLVYTNDPDCGQYNMVFRSHNFKEQWINLIDDRWIISNQTETPPAATQTGPGDVVEKYAAELQKIYDNRTAGEYTFIGAVYKILRDAGAVPKAAE